MSNQSLLLEAASRARLKARDDYSGFKVGAAVIAKSGKIYSGCNIESSSFGLTICAERVAIFKAISEGESELLELAVIADTEEAVSPCGACRQIMSDYMNSATVYLANLTGDLKETSVIKLIPDSFSKKDFMDRS